MSGDVLDVDGKVQAVGGQTPAPNPAESALSSPVTSTAVWGRRPGGRKAIDTSRAAAATESTDTVPARSQDYRAGLVSHRLATEARRLQLQQQLMDPQTIRLLAPRLRPDSRCLELGAGAGSIARWLAQRCPDGHVTATDIDLDLLDGQAPANLQLLRHDVAAETFPECSFDLIHARALLVHLAERDTIVGKVTTWLEPGGWLVVEEPCMFTVDSSPHPEFKRLMRAFRQGMEAKGAAVTRWSRRLPSLLAESGLVEVGLEVSPQYVGHGDSWQEYWQLFTTQVGTGLVDAGLLTPAELQAGLDLFGSPGFVDMPLAFIASWGCRPAADEPAR